jgi:putative selenium metabolism protein SsnA
MFESDRYIISNAWICRIENNSIKPVFGDLKISNGLIEEITERDFDEYIRGKIKSNSKIDAKGKVVTIPLINFHDHIYSRLAKGLAINEPMNNFQNILKNLWWKLDLLLDHDMIKASAKMAAIESIRNGVTYIFDHHASPANTLGSLKVIKNVLNEIDLRGVLCFETSDRNGIDKTKEALNENVEFYETEVDENMKSVFGMHASFTLENITLQKVSDFMKEKDTGVHIHVCEDKSDRDISQTKFGEFPVQRLAKYSLLNDKSILAHCIHLTDEDYNLISENGSAIVYNLDSNFNNAVGISHFIQVPSEIPILIGTDGMHANIARSTKQFFLMNRFQKNNFDDVFTSFNKLYFNQIKFAKRYFPDLSTLNNGNRADMIIWDYVPPTPLTNKNFWGHFIYGILEREVATVVHGGKLLMHELKITDIDLESINREIFEQGLRLFNKFNS